MAGMDIARKKISCFGNHKETTDARRENMIFQELKVCYGTVHLATTTCVQTL
jgi:hypothetical protein